MIVAVLDACVLYPASLRDILLWQATVRSYSPRFTDQINTEWTRCAVADNPRITADRLARVCELMAKVYPGSLVGGYEAHIPELSLPDEDDRHVLAAAIESAAPYIVTYNIRDFPVMALQGHGVAAIHPDTFLSALLDKDAARFLRGVRRHRASLTRPSKTEREYIATMRRNRLFRTAERLDELQGEI